MKRRFLASVVTMISVLSLCVEASAAESKSCIARNYKISAIPLRPAGINQSGEVAGTTPSHKAALWSAPGGLREIDLLPGFTSSEAVALNNAGQLIGVAIDRRTNRRQGFSYKAGKLIPLSDGSRALAINDAGVIAGESRTSSKSMSGPVLWKALTPVALGGCCGGTAVAMNNQGQVIGNIYDQQGRYHAFMWDKTEGLRQIGPPSDFSSALLLNDAGDYVLQLFPTGPVLYRDSNPTHLILAPKVPSHPKAMNVCGAIVGSFGIFADYYRAFAWDAAVGFRDLNSLVPADSGWKLQEATSINDRGEIVGWGTFKRDEDQGFLLTPLQ